jgi:hypothetical protein
VAKRTLTHDEKREIAAYERTKAQYANRGASITIRVEDETDDNGQAIVQVVTTTTVRPSGSKPTRA